MASMRLASDDSLDFALGKLALGRDDVRSFLADVMGVSLSRNTVAAALQELHEGGVVPRVGRLGSWVDRKAEGDWPKKLGAYVGGLAGADDHHLLARESVGRAVVAHVDDGSVEAAG
jgi:hypothetical protein